MSTGSTPQPPAVPGYDLQTLLRFSRAGETWTATGAGGEAVTVTLVAGAIESAAAGLARLRHAHVLPVVDVVAAGAYVALVSAEPPALTLASLCAERRAFDPGEVVTVGVPVAQALAEAHDRGVVHGDLDPSDVLIEDDGRPVLAGLGVAGLAGTAAAPGDDVLALAMILRSLLGDDTGPRAEAVRTVLAPALSGHPSARPHAADLAAALGLACPPQPLRRARPTPPRSDPPPAAAAASRGPALLARARQLRLTGAPLTAALAVAGLLLLLVAAPLFGGTKHAALQADPTGAPADVTTPAPAAPASSPVPAAPDWTATLRGIAAARDTAFSTLSTVSVAAADAPASTAEAIDLQRLQALRTAGVHARGLTSSIRAVAATAGGSDTATVRLREATSAYDLVAADGTVAEHRPAVPAAAWTVTLVRTAAGWRTAAVSAG